MWGLLWLAVLGTGAFIYSCKNDAEDARCREESKKNGLDTYVGNDGRIRLVSNNHPVVRTTRRVNGNWDDVYLDAKTDKILHNYSDDKRAEERKRAAEKHNADLEAKREAKARGQYFYSAYGESRVIEGFYEDMAPVNSWRHIRRVSDDLLLDKNTCSYRPIHDARCRLVVYDPNAEKEGNKKALYEHAKWNWSQINGWDNSTNRICWRDKSYFPTRAEVEAYARKIGAYLDTGENEKEEEKVEEPVANDKSSNPENFQEQVMIIYNYYLTHKENSFATEHITKISEELKAHGYCLSNELIKETLENAKKLVNRKV